MLVLVLVVVALVLGLAPPASAHASVVSTDPAAGAVLADAPERVRFTFSEPVATVPDGVKVYDAAGELVASSATADGVELAIALEGEVGDGTLIVTYRIVSKDGHPVSGSLIFSVGAPSPTVEEPPRDDAASTAVPRTLSLVRFVGYVGLFLGAGLLWFAVLFLPSDRAADTSRRRVVLGARLGGGVALVGWLLALPVTASYQVGGGVTWSALAATEYVVAAAVAVGLVVALVLLGSGAPGRRRGWVALAAAVVATTAPALTGHTRAATPEVLAVAADLVHLLAGSVWLGGLVGLGLVLADLSGRGTMAGEVLARFSGVAAGILAVLVVTGSLLAWRVLGSWSGLVDTTYGKLLLVKIGAALVVIAIAAFNRFRLLPRLQAAAHRKDRRAGAGLVVRSVVAESAVLVVVLLLTGFLVDRNPEGDPVVQASATARPTSRTAQLDAIEVRATLGRQTPGPTSVTLELLDPAGEPTEGYAAPQATFASDDVDLGEVPLRNIGPGVYTAEVVVPAPGDWRLKVVLPTSEVDVPTSTLEFDVLG
ncbi:copper resistance protein CopC [Nocardioides sp.]|uniref:copper resistance CopC/CopD family protein n=1 Tax=Nocardioides sp. TaxID=35761 RepID=UPI002720A013|nr:copper resistance protein CopC [Nocardioides sp.]MDO9456452.1 CopD family protein [Nocardioides sp.]